MPYDSFPILVARAPNATPTVFTTIAELDTVALPELTANEFDASVQNANIDKYVVSSLLRRKPLALTLNMLPYDASQDHLTGLYSAKINNTFDGYRFTHAASSLIWVASGYVTAISPKTPMEGKLQIDVTLRFSGVMSIQGVTVGS